MQSCVEEQWTRLKGPKMYRHYSWPILSQLPMPPVKDCLLQLLERQPSCMKKLLSKAKASTYSEGRIVWRTTEQCEHSLTTIYCQWLCHWQLPKSLAYPSSVYFVRKFTTLLNAWQFVRLMTWFLYSFNVYNRMFSLGLNSWQLNSWQLDNWEWHN